MDKIVLRFYRENRCWYADIPAYIEAGGHKADCVMVAGADKLLDEIAGKRDSILLAILSSPRGPEPIVDDESYQYILRLSEEKNGWGWYDVAISPNHSKVYNVGLCPVSTYVFGGHPKYIGFKEVTK